MFVCVFICASVCVCVCEDADRVVTVKGGVEYDDDVFANNNNYKGCIFQRDSSLPSVTQGQFMPLTAIP